MPNAVIAVVFPQTRMILAMHQWPMHSSRSVQALRMHQVRPAQEVMYFVVPDFDGVLAPKFAAVPCLPTQSSQSLSRG
jgi:hypothetical protein